jgi:hypothetical protein
MNVYKGHFYWGMPAGFGAEKGKTHGIFFSVEVFPLLSQSCLVHFSFSHT